MQTLPAGLQTAFELGTSVPERVFNYQMYFIVTNSNKYLDFINGGGNATAVIPTGIYLLGNDSSESGTLCDAIRDAMNLVDPAATDFLISVSTDKMTILAYGGLGNFSLRWLTGTHGLSGTNDNIGTLIGFDTSADDSGSQSYAGDYNISRNKSSYVDSYGSISRNAESITAGNVTLQIVNTDQTWNDILANPQNHIGVGLADSTIQLGYTAIGFITLFTGKLDNSDFSDIDSVGLSFRDTISDFTKKQVGSSQSPADYHSSASYTVFTNADWSSGRNPADVIWHLLTYWGGLDSTESTANTDIDWTTFSEFKNILSAIGYLVQGKFQGQTLANALKEICDKTNSTVFSEMDNKIYCRYWLGSDTASIQTYTSAKWFDLPKISMDKLAIKNRYEVYYGFTFPQIITGIATGATSTTLVKAAAGWTADAYKNMYVHITAGTGAGQTRMIASNDATTLTISFAWGTNPVATDTFEILDYSKATFSGSYTSNDGTSQTNYGIQKEIIDSDLVWFKDSASAQGYGERAVVANKDPIQYVKFTSGLYAYRQQLWDALYLTETFYSWTNQGFRVENLSFDINNEEVSIEGRLTNLFHYLILDHPEFGKLDSLNCLA